MRISVVVPLGPARALIEPCAARADVIATDDPAVAFKDADICVLVGSFPRKQGMERKDLLEKNANIFKAQGKAINDNAKPNVKARCAARRAPPIARVGPDTGRFLPPQVLVVGNPANTNALITHHFAPRVPAKNISALTRLDHNRCRSQVRQPVSYGCGPLRLTGTLTRRYPFLPALPGRHARRRGA